MAIGAIELHHTLQSMMICGWKCHAQHLDCLSCIPLIYGGGGCELDYAAEGGGTSKEDGTRIQGTRNAKGSFSENYLSLAYFAGKIAN